MMYTIPSTTTAINVNIYNYLTYFNNFYFQVFNIETDRRVADRSSAIFQIALKYCGIFFSRNLYLTEEGSQ